MIAWFLFVLLFNSNVLAGADPRERRQQCKNPKGKLWSTLLDKDCGQSVCQKKGKKLVWQQCPRPATQDRLQEMERTMLNVLATLGENIAKQCGSQTPIDCRCGSWGSWSSCDSKTGKKKRTRTCSPPVNGGKACTGSLSPTEDISCPVDGEWGKWGPWSSCDSKTGKKKRTRKCDSPAPLNGGKQCTGAATEEISCQGCNGDWSAFRSNCYKYFEMSLTWQEAENQCKLEGGHLASIHSKEENDFIKSLTSKWFWIGLTDFTEGVWVWSDGSPFSFNNWSGSGPSNSGGNEDCVHGSQEEDGNWNDINCASASVLSFICKTETSIKEETCQGNCCWQGPCRTIKESKGRADGIIRWPESHDSVGACAKRCEDLPDCKIFHYYGPGHRHHKDCYLHKGGVMAQCEDDKDRTVGLCGDNGPQCIETDTDYDGNDIGLVENTQSAQECACNCRENAECLFFTWNGENKACWLKNSDKGRRPWSQAYSGTRDCCNKKCPDGWMLFEGKCYGHPKDRKLSWTDAESFCQSWSAGAHLASIHSAGEQKFVQTTFPEDIWLGGNDMAKEGTWVWSDGTPWDYFDWHSGEPNNAGSGQDCLQGNWDDLQWDDNGCTEENLFLCMK